MVRRFGLKMLLALLLVLLAVSFLVACGGGATTPQPTATTKPATPVQGGATPGAVGTPSPQGSYPDQVPATPYP